jgi:hypothetical protein
MKQIADETGVWFNLSQAPVSERYRRRMQLAAFVSGLATVLTVYGDTFRLVKVIRSDSTFRATMIADGQRTYTADSTFAILADSIASLISDSTRRSEAATLLPMMNRAQQLRDSLVAAPLSASNSFLGYPPDFKPNLSWVVGIAISTLLVGLGAPFWHDVLEAAFGLKRNSASTVPIGPAEIVQSTKAK